MVAFNDGRRVSVVASKCECEWVGWDDWSQMGSGGG